MTQKVLQVGTSAAVTIPKKSLVDLGLKVGDQVTVRIDATRKAVIVEPFAKGTKKDVVRWTKRFIDRYRPTLEALAKQ
jgi:antitoxin component of MazEF toxin-antitoxin module